MLFYRSLNWALWTMTTSFSSLSLFAFNFGCFFLCSFQTSIWSHAIKIPDIYTSCFYGLFSLCFLPPASLALGLPRVLSGLAVELGFALGWKGLSPCAAWGPRRSAIPPAPKTQALEAPSSYQAPRHVRRPASLFQPGSLSTTILLLLFLV